MWFKKQNTIKTNEQLEKVIQILSNCHHLTRVCAKNCINSKIEYRFLDMLAGYYWQISIKQNRITIKTGDVILEPNTMQDLYKMLDIEINKSLIYEKQKQKLLIEEK